MLVLYLWLPMEWQIKLWHIMNEDRRRKLRRGRENFLKKTSVHDLALWIWFLNHKNFLYSSITFKSEVFKVVRWMKENNSLHKVIFWLFLVDTIGSQFDSISAMRTWKEPKRWERMELTGLQEVNKSLTTFGMLTRSEGPFWGWRGVKGWWLAEI